MPGQGNGAERPDGRQRAEQHGARGRGFKGGGRSTALPRAGGPFLPVAQDKVNAAGDAEPEQQRQHDDVGEIERHFERDGADDGQHRGKRQGSEYEGDVASPAQQHSEEQKNRRDRDRSRLDKCG